MNESLTSLLAPALLMPGVEAALEVDDWSTLCNAAVEAGIMSMEARAAIKASGVRDGLGNPEPGALISRAAVKRLDAKAERYRAAGVAIGQYIKARIESIDEAARQAGDAAAAKARADYPPVRDALADLPGDATGLQVRAATNRWNEARNRAEMSAKDKARAAVAKRAEPIKAALKAAFEGE